MPCHSDPVYTSTHDLAELDKVTRLLCKVMAELDSKPGHRVREVGLLDDKELKAWWKEHKAFDMERRKVEKAAEKAEEKKKAALAKLSKEDRKILGLE